MVGWGGKHKRKTPKENNGPNQTIELQGGNSLQLRNQIGKDKYTDDAVAICPITSVFSSFFFPTSTKFEKVGVPANERPALAPHLRVEVTWIDLPGVRVGIPAASPKDGIKVKPPTT